MKQREQKSKKSPPSLPTQSRKTEKKANLSVPRRTYYVSYCVHYSVVDVHVFVLVCVQNTYCKRDREGE